MDTKEIINVNDCEFLWKEKSPKRVCNNGNLNCDCNSNPNCDFKQRARAKEEIERLTEENEKLKAQIENEKQALQIYIDNLNQACLDLNQENDDLLNKLQAKEQECEKLKQWKEDAENLFKTQTDNADKIINRYKQTLNKIKNSLKTIMETNRVYPLQANLQKVLNIINKVKEQ